MTWTRLSARTSFWGQDGGQGWQAVKAALDAAPGAPAGRVTQCCGEQASDGSQTGACCG
jgi:hypothetical protein